MDLEVDVDDRPASPRFDARQGFTEVRVTGGRYRVHREQTITMRDPDGRGVLTLEDLRYSTLPDLFRFTVERDQDGDGDTDRSTSTPRRGDARPRSPGVARRTGPAR